MFGKPKSLQSGAMVTPRYIVEPKVDGFRVRFSTGISSRNNNGLIEAAIGRKRDYTHHFTGIKLPPGCVFDAEVVVNGSLQETSKVLSRAHAIPYSTMKIYVFDILEFCSRSTIHTPYFERRSFLESLTWPMADANPILMNPILMAIPIEILAQPYIEEGWEGIVIKQETSRYGEDWFKYKQQQTKDFLVAGYTQGQGEWLGTIGSIELFDIQTGLSVGQCSVGSDYHRDYFTTAAAADILDIIVEVEYQQYTASNQLRHPRLLRIRTDLMENN